MLISSNRNHMPTLDIPILIIQHPIRSFSTASPPVGIPPFPSTLLPPPLPSGNRRMSLLDRGYQAEDQNVVIVLSFVNGIDIVAQEFVATIEAISTNTTLSSTDQLAVENYLNRLPLAPRSVLPCREKEELMISYDREFTLLSQLSSEGSPLGKAFPSY